MLCSSMRHYSIARLKLAIWLVDWSPSKAVLGLIKVYWTSSVMTTKSLQFWKVTEGDVTLDLENIVKSKFSAIYDSFWRLFDIQNKV